MWRCTFETTQDSERWRTFYEPLRTSAPQSAQPYCCYIATVVFYVHPYTLDMSGHHYLEYDRVETAWNLFGWCWTDDDGGFSTIAPLVLYDDTIFLLTSGCVIWRNGGWQMKWKGHIDDYEYRVRTALARYAETC